MIKVAFEGAPAGRSQPVIGLWEATFEVFVASNVTGFLELARMNAQVAVSSAQKPLEIIKTERLIHSQSADDSKPHALVNQAVQVRSKAVGSSPSNFAKLARIPLFAMPVF
jgi:hypothetical protein